MLTHICEGDETTPPPGYLPGINGQSTWDKETSLSTHSSAISASKDAQRHVGLRRPYPASCSPKAGTHRRLCRNTACWEGAGTSLGSVGENPLDFLCCCYLSFRECVVLWNSPKMCLLTSYLGQTPREYCSWQCRGCGSSPSGQTHRIPVSGFCCAGFPGLNGAHEGWLGCYYSRSPLYIIGRFPGLRCTRLWHFHFLEKMKLCRNS